MESLHFLWNLLCDLLSMKVISNDRVLGALSTAPAACGEDLRYEAVLFIFIHSLHIFIPEKMILKVKFKPLPVEMKIRR